MTEPSLRELQRWIKRRIRPGQGTGAIADEPRAVLNPQRGTPGVERLAVYAGGYRARIREALAEVYAAILHVLGDTTFGELAQAYAARHPSHDYNLSLAGRHLPALLREFPLIARLPFLPDLAQLEWQVALAFHAFEALPLEAGQLAAVPPDRWGPLTLAFQPAVAVVESSWPILDIWEARTRPRSEVNIDLVSRPQRVLVSRQGLTVHCELVTAPQARVLTSLLAGRTLGEACAALAETGEAEPPIGEWFAQWTRAGLIVRIA